MKEPRKKTVKYLKSGPGGGGPPILEGRVAYNMRLDEVPDPDGQNEDRADWAAVAVDAFVKTTRTDDSDAVKDLLCDLMHYCQQNGQDFDVALDAARYYYAAETSEEG